MDNVKFTENNSITITHEVEYIRLTHKYIIPDDLAKTIFEYGDDLNVILNCKEQALTPDISNIHNVFQNCIKWIKKSVIPENLYPVLHMYKYIMRFERPNVLKFTIELPSNVYSQWAKVLNNNSNDEEE